MSLNRLGPAVIACAALLVACGQNGEESDAAENDEETVAVPVEIGTPTRGDIVAVYSGTAPIEAFAEADVIAKVAGEVRDILVEEGDDVSEGQIMARLDGDRLRLELNQSEANLRKLQRDYERNVELEDKGLISSGDFDKIKYEMEALEASFNLAKLELNYTQIRAPIDGVVSERFVRLGNTISSGEAVFRVTSFDPLVAYLHVPEREYRHIAKDQLVGIDIDALQGQRIVASVTRVSPVVDPLTGTFKITIEISDDKRRIKPGMFGRISIVYDQHENVLQIPRSAILEESDQTSVFVVQDGKAIRKVVQTGYSNSGMIEITDGLVDDDQVVTVGHIGLKDDAIVTVINAPDDTAVTAEQSDEQVSENAPTD
ncbi:MAG: efflux RND transporter periplasmic adaptor subunit [Gammaproteobacteria bacterium]|jgi:membrane fusion protein (multidrug efflux system)|nr:efflux RND transporter periplasmic adaptor subunit [Gammaproteobacteria bacterium]MDH3751086.1 efflux RND transporter periplasmic adaptor subunit [Gammaproteobacteria bacterium]MDH3805226.1 efflux RND transporter periplasmic adaptor subunit [Gammaproteobacteria bacterium]